MRIVGVIVISACLWLSSIGVAAATGQQAVSTSPANADGVPATNRLPANNDVNDGTDNTDVGLLQVEVGGVCTRTDATSHGEGTPLAFRYGAFEWLELSAGTDGYLWQHAINPANADGIGNLQLGARLRLFARPGGPPVLAVLPQVNLPTASSANGLGTGQADVLLAAVVGRDYPARSHVDVSYSADSIGAGSGFPRFAQQIGFVSGSLGVTRAWTPGLTFTWISRQDAVTGRAYTVSGDSALTLSRRMALDVSAAFGLTSESPSFELAAGLSFVVGTIDEDDGVHVRRHKLRLRARRRRTRTR